MRVRLNPGAIRVVVAVTAITGTVDLATKWVARRELTYGEDRWLVEGVAGLQLLRNRGVAFGLLEGRWFTLAMIVVAVAALIWLVFASNHVDSWLGSIGAGGMLGGALGNLIDRLPDGAVTDFIALGPWPRFNLADTALTLGVTLLALQQVREAAPATGPPLGET